MDYLDLTFFTSLKNITSNFTHQLLYFSRFSVPNDFTKSQFFFIIVFHGRSTSRYADLEKPKKKKTLSATTSLVSIPNTIKLSMLNSGLLSFGKFIVQQLQYERVKERESE